MSEKRCFVLFMALFLLYTLAACKAGIKHDEGISADESDFSSDKEDGEAGITPIDPIFYPDIYDFEYSDLSNMKFGFASGAGAWSTILEIMPDGSFVGYYHDSNGGERNECHFSGKFSPLIKTGDYEYSMRCESLIKEGVVGEEIIMDGIRVITVEPYGFKSAGDFSLYLPGRTRSQLSEAFLSCAHWYACGRKDVLSTYGLYNIGDQCGFVVWPE